MESDKSSKLVLVVDDEDTLLMLMGEDLNELGYETILAENGKQAISKFSENDHIDLVISDIRMPEMDGLKLLEAVKSAKPTQPFIFLSGYSDLSLEEFFSKGCEGLLPKPVEFEVLGAAIKEAILPLRERLSREIEKKGAVQQIDLGLGMSETIASSDKIIFGREGFFLIEEKIGFNVGDVLDVSLNFGDCQGSLCGQIMWIRNVETNRYRSGVGVKVIQASSSVIDFLEKNNHIISYIPIGEK